MVGVSLSEKLGNEADYDDKTADLNGIIIMVESNAKDNTSTRCKIARDMEEF